jgi:AraC-like DNA-binding protein
MRYEDADRSFVVRPGEMFITATAWTYRLEMNEDYAGLVFVVDPAAKPSWQEAAHTSTGRPTVVSGPLAAVAAGATALLQHMPSSTDAAAVESLVDIALRAFSAEHGGWPEQPPPAIFLRARLMVTQNISDEDYGPDRLARDLGLSRRSLYNAFDPSGLTPAQFIKQQRLERAKAELLNNCNIGITAIALRNGFADGTAFSHAFRAHYGISPREFRRSKLLS